MRGRSSGSNTRYQNAIVATGIDVQPLLPKRVRKSERRGVASQRGCSSSPPQVVSLTTLGEAIAGVQSSAKVLDRHALAVVATAVPHIGDTARDCGAVVVAPLGCGS